MPANGKHGYALYHLDTAFNAVLGKIHRDLFAHESRYDFVSRQFPAQEGTQEEYSFEERRARGDYAPMMARYSPLAKVIVGKNMDGTLVDLGCGTLAPIGRMLYCNRRRVAHYVGVDYRDPQPAYKPNFPATFMRGDVTLWEPTYTKVLEALNGRPPDFITTLECLEHMSKPKGIMFLDNIQKLAGPHTTIFLSTPCHDNVHLPHDHVYEWTWQELKESLEERFTIQQNMGTFSSQKDLLPHLKPEEREIWDKLSEFYDSSMLSVFLAPLYPQYSRNSIWRLTL